MRIPINIEVNDSNRAVCGQYCSFKCGDSCILFNDDLTEVSLQKGWVYQTDSNIPMLRCWKCRSTIGEADLCENDKE